MARISRRKILKFMIVTTGVVSASAVAVWYFRSPLHDFLYRISEDTATGSLQSNTIDTLMAVTGSLLGSGIEQNHYRSFFQWYATNIPGYKSTYERVAGMINRISRSDSGCQFMDCDVTSKHRQLEQLLTLKNSRLQRLWTGVRNREQLLFVEYIVQPVLALFARTDAWILLGYDHWVGEIRGLKHYRYPVPPSHSEKHS